MDVAHPPAACPCAALIPRAANTVVTGRTNRGYFQTSRPAAGSARFALPIGLIRAGFYPELTASVFRGIDCQQPLPGPSLAGWDQLAKRKLPDASTSHSARPPDVTCWSSGATYRTLFLQIRCQYPRDLREAILPRRGLTTLSTPRFSPSSNQELLLRLCP